jgi:uncharacterized protein
MREMIDFRIKPPVRDTAQDDRVELPPEMDRYDEIYGVRDRFNTPFDELVAEMEQHGIRGIIQAEYETTGDSRFWNSRTAQLVGRRPDLFLGGIATVDPRAPDALEELEWAHDELGLRGVVIQPGFLRLLPTDSSCYRVYAYCEQRGMPVTLHTGVNFTPHVSIEYGRPIHVDRVACDFPDLAIVCNHGGWPWVTEALAIAWKHKRVYLEFGAIAPKYLADPRGGWAPVTHWMDRQIRENVLLGTDWPMLRYGRLIEELPLLGLSEAGEEAYVRGNAERLIERVWG